MKTKNNLKKEYNEYIRENSKRGQNILSEIYHK